MPSTTTGANYFGQLLLNEAKSLGFTPNDYTIMLFYGGFSGGSSQVTALQDFNAQLMSTFGWSSSTAYAHEGFSGMNGRTDTAEYFYQSDSQTVLNFAESSGMSRFTFWSVNRDRQCNPPSNNGSLSSECSSVTQNARELTAYTVAFAKNTSVTSRPTPTPTPTTSSPTPTPTPTTSSGSGGCSAAAWVSNQAYVSGDVVSYGGSKWTTISGTTTRSQAGQQAPGTTTAPAKDVAPGDPSAPPGATLDGDVRRAGVSHSQPTHPTRPAHLPRQS